MDMSFGKKKFAAGASRHFDGVVVLSCRVKISVASHSHVVTCRHDFSRVAQSCRHVS